MVSGLVVLQSLCEGINTNDDKLFYGAQSIPVEIHSFNKITGQKVVVAKFCLLLQHTHHV